MRLGHQVLAAGSGRQLVELCRATDPELVVSEVALPDLDGIDAAVEVNREKLVPFLLVSACHDPETLARAAVEPVMGYLVKPVDEANLEAAVAVAVARFEVYRQARQVIAELRQSLEERKLVERAKGLLMREARVDEEDAFRRLQRLARNSNQKLVEAARMVLLAGEAFQPAAPEATGREDGPAPCPSG